MAEEAEAPAELPPVDLTSVTTKLADEAPAPRIEGCKELLALESWDERHAQAVIDANIVKTLLEFLVIPPPPAEEEGAEPEPEEEEPAPEEGDEELSDEEKAAKAAKLEKEKAIKKKFKYMDQDLTLTTLRVVALMASTPSKVQSLILTEQCINTMVSLLEFPYWPVTETCLRTLITISFMSAIGDMLYIEANLQAIGTCLAHSSPFIPGRALQLLKGLARSTFAREKIINALIEPITALLSSPKAAIKEAAVGTLGVLLTDPSTLQAGMIVNGTIERIVWVLAEGESEELQRAAAGALAAISAHSPVVALELVNCGCARVLKALLPKPAYSLKPYTPKEENPWEVDRDDPNAHKSTLFYNAFAEDSEEGGPAPEAAAEEEKPPSEPEPPKPELPIPKQATQSTVLCESVFKIVAAICRSPMAREALLAFPKEVPAEPEWWEILEYNLQAPPPPPPVPEPVLDENGEPVPQAPPPAPEPAPEPAEGEEPAELTERPAVDPLYTAPVYCATLNTLTGLVSNILPEEMQKLVPLVMRFLQDQDGDGEKEGETEGAPKDPFIIEYCLNFVLTVQAQGAEEAKQALHDNDIHNCIKSLCKFFQPTYYVTIKSLLAEAVMCFPEPDFLPPPRPPTPPPTPPPPPPPLPSWRDSPLRKRVNAELPQPEPEPVEEEPEPEPEPEPKGKKGKK